MAIALAGVRFGPDGLVPVVVQDAGDGAVLMLAYADPEALRRTLRERRAWFWSRSRRQLWRKGETSGHVMDVVGVRYDCDGDAVLYRVRPRGPACHTGERSCFFREMAGLEGTEERLGAGEAAPPPVAPNAEGAATGSAAAQVASHAGAAAGPAADSGAGTTAEAAAAAGPAAGAAEGAPGPGSGLVADPAGAGDGGSDGALGSVLADLTAVIEDRRRRRPHGSYVAALLAGGRGRMAQKVGEEAVEVAVAALGEGSARQVEELADLFFHALVLMADLGVRPGDVAEELSRRAR